MRPYWKKKSRTISLWCDFLFKQMPRNFIQNIFRDIQFSRHKSPSKGAKYQMFKPWAPRIRKCSMYKDWSFGNVHRWAAIYIKLIVKNYFEDPRPGNAQFSGDITELHCVSRFTAAIKAPVLAVVGTVCGEPRLVPKTRCTSHIHAAAR
jgi:hypothetical protein